VIALLMTAAIAAGHHRPGCYTIILRFAETPSHRVIEIPGWKTQCRRSREHRKSAWNTTT
jgi:hypothetical protein